MAKVVDADLALLLVVEGHEVQGREVARRVVEEHVLRAGVGGADLPVLGTGVPVVDRGVELQPGVRAKPRGGGDPIPDVAGAHLLARLSVRAVHEVPRPVVEHGLHEGVGEAQGIVGGLSAHRVVRVAVPVGRVLLGFEVPHALAGELDHLVDPGSGDLVLERFANGALQLLVLARIEAFLAVAIGAVFGVLAAGVQDALRMALEDAAAGDHGGDLALLLGLPIDVAEHVGMIGVEGDHPRRTACRAAALDGGGRPVAHLEEGEEPR